MLPETVKLYSRHFHRTISNHELGRVLCKIPPDLPKTWRRRAVFDNSVFIFLSVGSCFFKSRCIENQTVQLAESGKMFYVVPYQLSNLQLLSLWGKHRAILLIKLVRFKPLLLFCSMIVNKYSKSCLGG